MFKIKLKKACMSTTFNNRLFFLPACRANQSVAHHMQWRVCVELSPLTFNCNVSGQYISYSHKPKHATNTLQGDDIYCTVRSQQEVQHRFGHIATATTVIHCQFIVLLQWACKYFNHDLQYIPSCALKLCQTDQQRQKDEQRRRLENYTNVHFNNPLNDTFSVLRTWGSTLRQSN